jgi:hypothetical protein
MTCAVVTAVLAGTMLASSPCAAQEVSPAVRQLGRIFINNGLYIPTAPSPGFEGVKFYNQNLFHRRILSYRGASLTGGFDWITADDKFFPFTGGSQFGLFGASLRLTNREEKIGIRPYATLGFYAGRLRSERLGFDVVRFTPSASVGFTWQFHKNMSLSGDYRISQRINGFNTDGFSLALRLF